MLNEITGNKSSVLENIFFFDHRAQFFSNWSVPDFAGIARTEIDT
jgi:hypothetical protein